MKRVTIAIGMLLFAFAAAAQESDFDLITGVQDNSFLLEEAYNQDPGVVQHINVLTWDHKAKAWGYAFTQEWPIRSLTHQFSYSVPVGYVDGDTELGDITLNYRYQWIGDGGSRTAVSPRLSLILPTGEGSDDTGVQVGLPISHILTQRLIAHTNVGATVYTGDTEADYFLGQSLIYAISPRVNVLVEALWSGSDGEGSTVVSPGIRWAHNLKNGAQLVPGVAYVIGEGNDVALFYLSYEK